MPIVNIVAPHPMEPNIRWLLYLSASSSPRIDMTAESASARAGELEVIGIVNCGLNTPRTVAIVVTKYFCTHITHKALPEKLSNNNKQQN